MPTTWRCRGVSSASSHVSEAAPTVGVVGSAVLELVDGSRVGAIHAMPTLPEEVRWAALFSSPFFHPAVVVDRDVLDRHELRYDTSFEESEDYDLWSRLLEVVDGENVPDPLVLYRVHPGQASQRRRELQRECQLRVAHRAIAAVAPGLSPDEVELAWRVGAGEQVEPASAQSALDAILSTSWTRSSTVRGTPPAPLLRVRSCVSGQGCRPSLGRESRRLHSGSIPPSLRMS